jgi:hypothetical protein
MPDYFGVPVVTCLRAFFHCTQGYGCDKHPAFPAPLISEAMMQQSSDESRRENEISRLPACA